MAPTRNRWLPVIYGRMGRGIGAVLDRRDSTLFELFIPDRAECLMSQMFALGM